MLLNSIIISFVIILIIYKFLLYPKLRLIQIKRKYGDKIKVIHHYGPGLLVEYKKSYTQNKDSLSFLRQMAYQNGKSIQAYAFNIGTNVGYSFVDPELIKQVHQNHDAFQKIDVSQAIAYLFSNSLLFATGKSWQKQRQFLGKSFHYDEIKNYFPSIKDICLKVSDRISEELIQNPNKEIKVVKTCEQITSEVVFRAFFGATSENIFISTENGSTKIPISQELVSVIMDSFRILQQSKLIQLKSQLLKRKTFNIFPLKEEKKLLNRLITLKQACKNIVLKRKEELVSDPSLYKKNFIDLYLKEIIQNSNNEITIEEIVDNFCALFFAGTDTTGNMTGAALYFLSLNPKIQQEAREEVMQIIKQKANSSDLKDIYNYLSFEDLTKLDLINSILKESLRLLPPASGVLPRISNRDIKIGQFEVKKGDLVNTHFIYHQSNPEVYENQDQFNPYRWMKGKEQNNAFNFTPFSLGPRNCIGQHLAMIEGKCILINFLINFDIMPIPQKQVQYEMKVIYGLQPDDLVYFRKRNN
ncbi:cytochrome P450 family monooxygenase (macronuclear) [Tetrahymena thermophila SB210]|uniref:Cytochrome P450 family monooxygenase n=2 Tax=Tetrahymena thermophila TaxID=5911 RepID=Q22NM8_TETTS|nr:cytochrome P450 family monooxygenase [Tetrahymena thermophila SB210]ABY59960.1 cytochrome P450 monooxygenase CYP5005A2 [Tetrahymena thermophila]EAR86757.2 cytochrome P450 family monooxygenase [Tetrahymena thermophila SB210]|eukprot:XP_001007002.2 cytochrome P450 family monooxygenase [Tetrahymena thermophila SB210]